MTASGTRIPALIGAVLAAGLLAGCGPGSTSASSASSASSVSVSSVSSALPSSVARAAAAAGLPTSTAGVGDNGSVDARICAAIAADVAAITRNVSHPATFPGQCAYDGGATTVSFDLNDPRHSAVTDVLGAAGNKISGVGDHAVWDDGDGHIVPTLGAWKGSVSCLVQPDSDVENDTVAYTGKSPFTLISAAAGAVYAQKMGKVCTDVFAAAG